MRYVDQVLQPGEKILQVTTITRVGYIRGIVVLVVAFLVWYLAALARLSAINLAGDIAASRVGEAPLIATDLIEAIPEAWSRILAERAHGR